MRCIKRLFDIFFSVIGLIVLSPAYIIIYIGFKLSSGGDVIYRQERVGLHGKPFIIYKFRTMVRDSEADGTPLLAEKSDKRQTKLGKFLRAHHLDELPQLWNVLKGDMSFVGYRPERQYFIDKIMERRPDYVKLYAMRPGITSLATLYNGYTDTIEKMITRLDWDLKYVENYSIFLDIKIITLTVLNIVSGKKF